MEPPRSLLAFAFRAREPKRNREGPVWGEGRNFKVGMHGNDLAMEVGLLFVEVWVDDA